MTELEKFLAKSKELREAATPGPWTHKTYEEWGYGTKHWIEPIESTDSSRYYLNEKGPINLDFIAHARNTAEVKDEMIKLMADTLKEWRWAEQNHSGLSGLDRSELDYRAKYALDRVDQLAMMALTKVGELAK